ncbi:hypothetical protein [Magnetofaba australis]|uniref:Putative Transferase hexapeptide repeat containing protein n=1 Tax=Magnetofaba australis IT-1 TaxID=1434232 RepID=A0A1Y2K2J0_9PROT|nr:hypothetical protein [Magnetofaba australis]OSM02250.1 putative Transferase hexapeptide repeat containing protein [Magnetofaba australis IT-1]
MRPLILFPFNGNAREAVGVVEAINAQRQTWSVLGFVDDDPDKKGSAFGGYPVLGGREVLAERPDAAVLAVPGRPDNFHKRRAIIEALNLKSERWATLIHPAAVVGPECMIGDNVLIQAGVVLTAGARIARHSIILPQTVAAHDADIGEGVVMGSHVTISGACHVEPWSYIGSGVKLREGVRIGTGALVGLGATVIGDVAPGKVAVGCPARAIRDVDKD